MALTKILIIPPTPRTSGQLANRIGLFAHFLAFAIERNFYLLNMNIFPYGKYFISTNAGLCATYPFNFMYIPANKITKKLMHSFPGFISRFPYVNTIKAQLKGGEMQEEDIFQLTGQETSQLLDKSWMLICKGWRFRCYDLVSKHQDKIRDFFEPQSAALDYAKSFMEKVNDRGNIKVGVHMRWGDFRGFYGGKYFYTIDQYKNLMHKFNEIFPENNTVFIIFCNEPVSDKEFDGLDVVISGGNEIEDLTAMADCDYIIGPPSSYSGWASFYGKVPLYMVRNTDTDFTVDDFRIYLPLELHGIGIYNGE